MTGLLILLGVIAAVGIAGKKGVSGIGAISEKRWIELVWDAIDWGIDLTQNYYELPHDQMTRIQYVMEGSGFRYNSKKTGRTSQREFYYKLQDVFEKNKDLFFV